MSKAEWLLDFCSSAGVVQLVDYLNDNSAYYLVEKNDKQYLVKVTKDFIITNELAEKVNAKKVYNR